MEKWEYLELKAITKKITNTKGSQFYFDDNKISVSPLVVAVNGKWLEPIQTEESKFPQLQGFLATLGLEGWELVSIVRDGAGYYGQTDYLLCYLKRINRSGGDQP